MNQKELGELRRRLRPDKSAIKRIYGCYVNCAREIVTYVDGFFGSMTEEEEDLFMGLLRKPLSGSFGRNLIDVVFTNEQVMEGAEHKLLSDLRRTKLEDAALREQFFRKIADTLEMNECNHLILLALDSYDVPFKGRDDEEQEDASDTVFNYLVCAVCPVKDGKAGLGFCSGENEFHTTLAKQMVGAPSIGFLFPAFDDRKANLYNALYYTRDPANLHQEVIDAVFKTEPPMSAPEQKEHFESVLVEALGEACDLEVVQAVHEQLTSRIIEHKESHDPEPLEITARDVSRVLTEQGVAEQTVTAFEAACDEQFGAHAALTPDNLVDTKRFVVQTEAATITVSPENSYLVKMREIDGRKYLLIPADSATTVNGVGIRI